MGPDEPRAAMTRQCLSSFVFHGQSAVESIGLLVSPCLVARPNRSSFT